MKDDFVHCALACHKQSNYELNTHYLFQYSLLCLLGLLKGWVVLAEGAGGLWILIFLLNHGLLIGGVYSVNRLHGHGELRLR